DSKSIPWNLDCILREASGCILASQVPHEMAVAALETLTDHRLLPPSPRATSEAWIGATLRSPLTTAYPPAYPFPPHAARRLSRLALLAEQVADIVLHHQDVSSARRSLVKLACGLGAKQSSLLLRNVRANADLAVLDVHLLAFMRIAGLTTSGQIPRALAEY